MGKVISIGKQNFASLRENDCFYIDKSELIREWWESQDDITLITRPRRFGKTLNMSMLNCFFSNQYAGKKQLFEGLSIWNDEKYRILQGSYPVIFLSFASIKFSIPPIEVCSASPTCPERKIGLSSHDFVEFFCKVKNLLKESGNVSKSWITMPRIRELRKR